MRIQKSVLAIAAGAMLAGASGVYAAPADRPYVNRYVNQNSRSGEAIEERGERLIREGEQLERRGYRRRGEALENEGRRLKAQGERRENSRRRYER
jgi:hypothetical protein